MIYSGSWPHVGARLRLSCLLAAGSHPRKNTVSPMPDRQRGRRPRVDRQPCRASASSSSRARAWSPRSSFRPRASSRRSKPAPGETRRSGWNYGPTGSWQRSWGRRSGGTRTAHDAVGGRSVEGPRRGACPENPNLCQLIRSGNEPARATSGDKVGYVGATRLRELREMALHLAVARSGNSTQPICCWIARAG